MAWKLHNYYDTYIHSVLFFLWCCVYHRQIVIQIHFLYNQIPPSLHNCKCN